MSKRTWSSRRLRQFPELRHFDRSDRVAIRWIGMFRDGWFLAMWTLLFQFFIWTIFSMAVCVFVINVLIRALPQPDNIVALCSVCSVLAWIVGCFVVTHRGTLRTDRYIRGRLRAELRVRSIPICIACGYEGGDMNAPRCPECGTQHATE